MKEKVDKKIKTEKSNTSGQRKSLTVRLKNDYAMIFLKRRHISHAQLSRTVMSKLNQTKAGLINNFK